MKYLVLTLSAIVVFAACSKKPDSNTNNENILRDGKWSLAAATITFKKPNGKDTTVNYLEYIPDCYKDDYVTFDSTNRGKRYVNGTACSQADPEYTPFVWQLSNNGKTLDLYNGFNTVFQIDDQIQPYHFDTLQQSPLVLDTIHGVLDTVDGFTRTVVVLDTIRELRFAGVPLGATYTGSVASAYDIHNADVITLSTSTLAIHFSMQGYYTDSTNVHAGAPGLSPLTGKDTMDYIFTYRK